MNGTCIFTFFFFIFICYCSYADLKPPTSPTPSPPSKGGNIVDKVPLPAETSKATEAVDPNLAKVEVQKTRPLSPYTALSHFLVL